MSMDPTPVPAPPAIPTSRVLASSTTPSVLASTVSARAVLSSTVPTLPLLASSPSFITPTAPRFDLVTSGTLLLDLCPTLELVLLPRCATRDLSSSTPSWLVQHTLFDQACAQPPFVKSPFPLFLITTTLPTISNLPKSSIVI
ncbi:hypothetical protein BJ166DRAFT_626933, partial [Pestalotiopsis sp. NC0098]